MKKLITTDNGGFTFVLDDLRWMESGILEALKGFLDTFGQSVILHGVVLNDLVGYTVEKGNTAGYVYINGELFEVEARTTPGGYEVLKWNYIEVDETFDPAGLKVFENSTSHETYVIRKAKIVNYATAQTGKIAFGDLVKFNDILKAKCVEAPENLSLAPGWVAGLNPVSNPKFRIDGKICQLYGDLKYVGPTTWLGNTTVQAPVNIMANLPARAKPIENMVFPAMFSTGFTNTNPGDPNTVANGVGYTWVWIEASTGNIYCDPVVANAGNSIVLSFSIPIN